MMMRAQRTARHIPKKKKKILLKVFCRMHRRNDDQRCVVNIQLLPFRVQPRLQ